jgi:hypothetical protein
VVKSLTQCSQVYYIIILYILALVKKENEQYSPNTSNEGGKRLKGQRLNYCCTSSTTTDMYHWIKDGVRMKRKRNLLEGTTLHYTTLL